MAGNPVSYEDVPVLPPYYLVDPDEFKKFHAAGAHEIYCPEVVGKAARWLTEIIVEAKQLPEPE